MVRSALKIYLMHFQHCHIKLIVKWMDLTQAPPPPPLQPCWSCSLNYRQLDHINATINWTEAKQVYKSVIRLLIYLMRIFYLCANLLNCLFFNLSDSVHMEYWKCKRNTRVSRNLKRFSRTICLQELLINLQFFHRIKTDEILVFFSNSSFPILTPTNLTISQKKEFPWYCLAIYSTCICIFIMNSNVFLFFCVFGLLIMRTLDDVLNAAYF